MVANGINYSKYATYQRELKIYKMEIELRKFMKDNNLQTFTATQLQILNRTLAARANGLMGIPEWR